MIACPGQPMHAQLMRCGFPLSTPERVAFHEHLGWVARALAAIDAVEAKADSTAGELEAIRACIGDAGIPARASGPVADACRTVLDGYEAGWSALDSEMLARLVRLGDLVPAILADEARHMLAFGALRQMLCAFDSAEHRDAERHRQAAAALGAVYRVLGLRWPASA